MQKKQLKQYEMLVRVRPFGVEHKERFPDGSQGQAAFAAVNEAVAQIDAFTKPKLTSHRVSKIDKQAVKAALSAKLSAIAWTARVMAKAEPGADAMFPMPERQGDVAVLQTARLFLDEAGKVKDRFISGGLPSTFIEDLQQAIGRFEGLIAGRSAAKVGAAASKTAIRSALKRGVDAVSSLDAFMTNVLGTNEVVMSAWKAARHVETAARNPTPATTAGEVPAPPAEPANESLKQAS